MNRFAKIAIVAALVIAVGIVIALKNRNGPQAGGGDSPQSDKPLPRLVDVGAGKCISCILMKPILEELRRLYKGQLEVVFVDIGDDPDARKPYDVYVMPTQIFYDASGRELFRHEGFMSREDIEAKWSELGIELVASEPRQPEKDK
jgi:thioredoxin 1